MSVEILCPSCGKTSDVGHSAGHQAPEAGDPALCVYCGTLLWFETDGWEVAPENVRTELLRHQEVVNALMMQREYRAWIDADRERMTDVLRVWMSVAQNRVLPFEKCVQACAESLTDLGFHTHREATL